MIKNLLWASIGLNSGIFFLSIIMERNDLLWLSIISTGLCLIGVMGRDDD